LTDAILKVTIDTKRLQLDKNIYTLWVRLQADNGVPGLFEWGLRGLPYDDGPVMQNGAEVTAPFETATPAVSTTATATGSMAAAPAVTKNAISFNSLEYLNSGVIQINSVDATQDSWVVVYKSQNYGLGDIVGYTHVSRGASSNVNLTIDTWKLPAGQTTLWARLQADNGVPGLFEWGQHGLPYNDAPVLQNGQPVVVAFGITDW
jgi:hypothetical protein